MSYSISGPTGLSTEGLSVEEVNITLQFFNKSFIFSKSKCIIPSLIQSHE